MGGGAGRGRRGGEGGEGEVVEGGCGAVRGLGRWLVEGFWWWGKRGGGGERGDVRPLWFLVWVVCASWGLGGG